MPPAAAPRTIDEAAPRAAAAPDAGGPGFVCFCGQDWWYHNRAHSDFQLMTRIAATRKVLLVNSIGMRMPLPGRSAVFGRRVLRKIASMLKLLRRPVADLPDYWVMTPVMLPFYGIRWVREVSAWIVRKQVELALRRAGIDRPIVFVTIPTALPIATRLDRRALVYNRSDKHSAFAEADPSVIGELEQGLLEEADLVLYASRELQRQEGAWTGDRSYFFDHGVDLDHFTQHGPEPADLRSIPRPRVGFFGGLDDYTVDLDLLERVAVEIPEAHLVLVGRVMCSPDRLARHKNVHVLGFRPYADIPAYGSGFDVALMPWLRNEWIRHCNPIKLKEYLALGLDVVSTDFPELRRWAGLVRIAGHADDFVAQVRESLATGPKAPPAALRAAVAGSTWEGRTHELLAVCDRIATRDRRRGGQGRSGRSRTFFPVALKSDRAGGQ